MVVPHYGWITVLVLAQCVVTGLAEDDKAEEHCLPNTKIDKQKHTVCYKLFKYLESDTAPNELKKMEEVCTNATIVADGLSRRMYPLNFDVQAEVDFLGEMIEKRVNDAKLKPRCSSHFPFVRRLNSLPKEEEIIKDQNVDDVSGCYTYSVKRKKFYLRRCRGNDYLKDGNDFIYVICRAKFVPAPPTSTSTPGPKTLKPTSPTQTSKQTKPAAAPQTRKPAQTRPVPASQTPKPAQTRPVPASQTPKPAQTRPVPAPQTPKPTQRKPAQPPQTVATTTSRPKPVPRTSAPVDEEDEEGGTVPCDGDDDICYGDPWTKTFIGLEPMIESNAVTFAVSGLLVLVALVVAFGT